MPAIRTVVCGLALLTGTVALAGPSLPPAPVTARQPVKDAYHGVQIEDSYRWLEDWNDAKVKAWSDVQNDYARTYLDKIGCVPALRERVSEIETAVGDRYLEFRHAGEWLFAAKSVASKQQPLIVALKGLDARQERVVIDPNALDADGHTSFDWFVPSPDGRLLAVSLSSGGSEAGDVRIFDVETGKERTEDRVPRVNGGTAGGSLAWLADSSGFLYTRYPREGERPKEDMDFYVQVYRHTLGVPSEKDEYQTGQDYPRIAEIVIEVSKDGKWALTNVQNGDGGEFIQDVCALGATPTGEPWKRLSAWDDRVIDAKFGPDSALYLVSRKDAPNGQVLRLVLDKDTEPSLANAKPIIPEQPDASIETDFFSRSGLYLGSSRIYVLYQNGGPNELRVFDIVGEGTAPNGVLESLPISTVEHVEVLEGDDVMFQNDSFIAPPAWYVLRSELGEKGSIGRVVPTAFKQAPPPHIPELEVRREFATSKDGAKVPLNIIARKDVFKLYDAVRSSGERAEAMASAPGGASSAIPAPALVWGYGGYGVNQSPAFSRRTLLFCEQGGIMVFTNIRGGGEYGEKWHLEGNLLNKQNVFNDFAACCRHLIEKGYTTSEQMAIIGGSNGGLLMAATFTQHPELCRAVVSSVGIYDMLRVELSANGAFNITEFGTVKDKAQFDALHAYSPYHRVREGVKYPAVLFMTGANDPRVDPMQSRKMTALMQSAQADIPASKGGPSPVLLRTSGNTGHGSGTPLNARIEQTVDTFAFLFDQLGVKYERPGKK